MPRPKLSEAEIATMQEAILDAAAHLLHEGGFEALTMRAIAERVGVSHMVLYNYFENREALLAALRERQRARLALRRETALREAREGDLLAVMRRMLGHFRRMADHHPRMYRLIWVQPIGDRRVCRLSQVFRVFLAREHGIRMEFHRHPLGV